MNSILGRRALQWINCNLPHRRLISSSSKGVNRLYPVTTLRAMRHFSAQPNIVVPNQEIVKEDAGMRVKYGLGVRMRDENKKQEEKTRPIVGYLYLASGALVFTIVVVGGLTRLTESGLSIVEWNVIKGMHWPQSQAEWQNEFDKYKLFPEYHVLNSRMTLEEFKAIFFMEWAHRMLGRLIGVTFVVPAIYFAAKGYMSRAIQMRSVVVAAMIGSQGLLGWYMVKSGLSEELLDGKSIPRVSHYWLAAHLGSAFTIYAVMLVTGLSILKSHRPPMHKAIGGLQSFKSYSVATCCLVFTTAMSGALVAGLDAGLIYNEFPFMGNGIVPADFWALSSISDRNQAPISWIRNLLENPSAVQFNHRLLACTTFTAIFALWLYSRRLRLPPNARVAINSLLGVAVVQVSLGIATLVYFVPIPVAAAHQAGSLTLLSVALWLLHILF